MTTAPIESRKAAKFLFFFFILLAVGTFAWGFFVAEKVRARARQVDGALRSVAWACLCYSQPTSQPTSQQTSLASDHLWPDSDASLIASTGAWSRETIESPGAQWPATREAALAGTVAPANAAEALAIVGVEFSKDPHDCPHITALGNPSGLDTLEVVNAWLTEYAKAQFSRSLPAPIQN